MKTPFLQTIYSRYKIEIPHNSQSKYPRIALTQSFSGFIDQALVLRGYQCQNEYMYSQRMIKFKFVLQPLVKFEDIEEFLQDENSL